MSEFKKDYPLLCKRAIELGNKGYTKEESQIQLFKEGITFNGKLYTELDINSPKGAFITRLIMGLDNKHFGKVTQPIIKTIGEKINACELDFDTLQPLDDQDIVTIEELIECYHPEDDSDGIVDLCKCTTQYNDNGTTHSDISYKSFEINKTCADIC